MFLSFSTPQLNMEDTEEVPPFVENQNTEEHRVQVRHVLSISENYTAQAIQVLR